MELVHVSIKDEWMTLGQLLKYLSVIDSGGQAKGYLQTYYVYVNGTEEMRRGKKLYPGDEVILPKEDLQVILLAESQAHEA